MEGSTKNPPDIKELNMVRVERGNVVLDVKDDVVDHYLTLGYNVVDEQGRIIKTALPTNLGTLQAAYVAHEAKIAELESEVEKLKDENEALKTKPAKKSKKVEED